MEQYIQKLIVSWEKYMLYDCYCRIIINKTHSHYYMFSLARELVQGADQEPDRQAQAGRGQGWVRWKICPETSERGCALLIGVFLGAKQPLLCPFVHP